MQLKELIGDAADKESVLTEIEQFRLQMQKVRIRAMQSHSWRLHSEAPRLFLCGSVCLVQHDWS